MVNNDDLNFLLAVATKRIVTWWIFQNGNDREAKILYGNHEVLSELSYLILEDETDPQFR
jgi:hypothetical protein